MDTGLESGAELLGLKDIEGHRADLSDVQRGILNRPDVKFSYGEDPAGTIEKLLNPGSGFKGHDIKEAPATKEDIEKHYRLTAKAEQLPLFPGSQNWPSGYPWSVQGEGASPSSWITKVAKGGRIDKPLTGRSRDI